MSYTYNTNPNYFSDQSPPTSAKVENAWSYTSSPPHDSTACCLIKDSKSCVFAGKLKFYLIKIFVMSFIHKSLNNHLCNFLISSI
jgi:hypothetical protein